MKTINSIFLKVLFLFALISTGNTLRAQEIDLGELELGKEYELTAYKPCKATFTAPKTGVLVASCTRSYWPEPYLDAEYTNPVAYKHSYVSTGSIWEFQVEEGTKYYFYRSFLFDDGVFSINYAETEVMRKSVKPAEGSVLDISGAGQINIEYNMNVEASDVTLSVGGTVLATGVAYVSGRNVSIPLKGENAVEINLLALLSNGTLSGGETLEFTLTVTSVNNPELTLSERLTFVCPEMLTMLKEEKLPAEFLSYWFSGEESGMLRLTFDNPLLQPSEGVQGPFVRLQYGNPESDVEGDCYTVEMPCTVDGNSVVADFTGVRRRATDMLTSGNTYGAMLVKVLNIKDANGRYVHTGNSGTLGSFSYEIAYRTVDAEAVYEFMPAPETNLSVSEVELWIQNYASIRFDGVNYTYIDADGNEVVETKPLAELAPEVDSYGDAIIMIPVREDLRIKDNLKISLANLMFIDGVEREISAVYNPTEEYLSISGIAAGAPSEAARFSVDGIELASPRKGINIVKMSDGAVKKVMVK